MNTTPQPHMTIDDVKNDLFQMRDEVRVKLHLLGMDAKQEWEKIEDEIVAAEGAAKSGAKAARDKLAHALARVKSFNATL